MESKPTPLTDARIAKHGSCAGLNELAAHYNDLLDHARRLERAMAGAEEALNRIASWREGAVVGSSFDEPGSAGIARAALAQIEELRNDK